MSRPKICNVSNWPRLRRQIPSSIKMIVAYSYDELPLTGQSKLWYLRPYDRNSFTWSTTLSRRDTRESRGCFAPFGEDTSGTE
jgi:hypothetical protein